MDHPTTPFNGLALWDEGAERLVDLPIPWGRWDEPFRAAWDGVWFVVHWLGQPGGNLRAARWLGDSWERLPIEGYWTRTLVEAAFTSAADPMSGQVGFLSWRNPLHLYVHDRGGIEIFTRNIPVERGSSFAYPALAVGRGRIAVAARTLGGTAVLELGPDGHALGAEGWIAEDERSGFVTWRSKAFLLRDDSTELYLVNQTRLARVTVGPGDLVPETILTNDSAACMLDASCTTSGPTLFVGSLTALEHEGETWLGFRDESGDALSGKYPEVQVPPYRLLRVTEPCTTRSFADEVLGIAPRSW